MFTFPLPKFSCRSPVKGPTGLKRLDAKSGRLQTPKSSLEPKGGPICLVMEQADEPIRELAGYHEKEERKRLPAAVEGTHSHR